MTPASYASIHRRLVGIANPARAKASQWFFKTGAGEYAEGDRFLGIRVPVLRAMVREYATLPLSTVTRLLRSPWHEERLLAVLILGRLYDRGTDGERAAIFRLYLASRDHINNWDIVDSSAPHIVGRHLAGKGRGTLMRLARSKHLWSRRVAVVATQHDIRKGAFGDTLALARVLLKDEHDLIHKATGWMLREVGDRDVAALETFLTEHAPTMPRTMLRYAIEKLPAAKRRHFMGAGRARLT